MKKVIILLLVILVMLTVAACGASPESAAQNVSTASDSPQIKVIEPWSRPSPAMAGNGAVYMMLMNEGGRADTLVSVETDVAEVVELHETKIENDVMKMSPVQGGIEVPGGGSVELKPGGLHVMLINLKEELVPGEIVTLTLNFENSGPLKVEAEIREMGAGLEHDMAHDHGEMEHDSHEMNHNHQGEQHEEIPNNGAVIHIVTPEDGAIFKAGQGVMVEIKTENFELAPDDKHWHIYVDGELNTMVTDGMPHATLADLEPGEHQISVFLANKEHQQLEDGATITIMVHK